MGTNNSEVQNRTDQVLEKLELEQEFVQDLESVQVMGEEHEKELEANLIWDTFKMTYLDVQGKYEYLGHEIISRNDDKNNQIDEINLTLKINGKTSNLSGKGNGPIDSFINALENTSFSFLFPLIFQQ